MRVYFVCGSMMLLQPGSDGRYPVIQAVRDSAGPFECRWAIHGDEAAGVAEATAVQVAILHTTPDLVVWTEAETKTPIEQGPLATKLKLEQWLDVHKRTVDPTVDRGEDLIETVMLTCQPGWVYAHHLNPEGLHVRSI